MRNFFSLQKTAGALISVFAAHQSMAALPSHPIVQTFEPSTEEVQSGANIEAGSAVAIRGNTALVGMPGIEKVAVFSRTTDGWARTSSITPPEIASRFGLSLAYCNDIVTVGAASAAYVFRLVNGAWHYTAKLTAPAMDQGVTFPRVLACHDHVVAAGNSGFNTPGAVYVYQLGPSARLQRTTRLQLDDAHPNDGFGADVALSADTLLVGAPGSDGGSAYLYRRSTQSWLRTQQLNAADSQNERFGAAVAIQNGVIVVGAPGEDPQNVDLASPDEPVAAGAAFVFLPNSLGQYAETERIRPSSADAPNFINFGDQITFSNDRLAIHAVELIQGPGEFAAGYVATYRWVGTQAIPLAFTPYHPQENSTLSLSNRQLLIGQPYEEQCGFDRCIGQASLFDLNQAQ